MSESVLVAGIIGAAIGSLATFVGLFAADKELRYRVFGRPKKSIWDNIHEDR